ncbi:angiopoietin-1 receptor-like [Amphiura filiformis]|uniref:angiopoietin-1 receptor-like n=1 Tax=Amphiura filiformis TaxID=82378 RepID=UPI003B21F5E5
MPRDPAEDNPHDLADGDIIRLHLGTTYLFTCNAEEARPAAELSYRLIPPHNFILNLTTTEFDPDPRAPGIPLGQLFASESTLSFREDDFGSTGSDLCCRVENTATYIGCDPSPVEHCVELEIIDEPSELLMEMKDAYVITVYEPVGELYTYLKESGFFVFGCTTFESAPAADIKWYFTPRNGVSFDLIAHAGAPTVLISNSSGPSSINGHMDTLSNITFEATNEIHGGTLRCCAEHVAIPGGTGDAEGDVYDEDPNLEPLCVETVLQVPAPCGENLQLLDVTADGMLTQSSYVDGDTVLFRQEKKHTVSCISTAALDKPTIDVYILEPNAEMPILLNATNGVSNFIETEKVKPSNSTEEIWYVRKDVTLSLGGDFDIDGAQLICQCVNTVYGEDLDRTIQITLAALVPGPPRNIRVVDADTTSITVEWTEPLEPNGAIALYHIDYRALEEQSLGSTPKQFTNLTQDVRGNNNNIHTFTIQDLQPGQLYKIYVSAENSQGEGKAVSLIHKTIDGPVSSTVVGIVVAVIIVIIVISVVVILMVRRRRRQHDKESQDRQADNQVANEGIRFNNQAFTTDDNEGYDNTSLNSLEYEEVTSSEWDIEWNDLSLSGKILGKGNFGDVQMGRVLIKDKWIHAAVKTLKEGTPVSERALFKEEFDTMTRIGHHPNVVNILGSCEHAGSFYVVLEYVHHGNLRKYLRKSRKESEEDFRRGKRVVTDLSQEQLLNFALGVAKAMKHVSDCGVIHRDLAARNVLVGRGLTAKVADFGMSREENIYVQQSNQRVPTRWLSIESLTQKLYSTKSDVWSFGILLWEIATFGGTPYSDIDTKNISHYLRSGYRMPNPNCGEDMYKLMSSCWLEDPDARPSFQDIVNVLTNMAEQQQIYMSTHYYENFKHAAIRRDKDDR